MKTVYYGRISTTDGQTSASQYDDAKDCGVKERDTHIDEGVSGYHVAPMDRTEWRRVMDKLSDGGVLYVRWLDRISRRYDELHSVMRLLMKFGVKVVCTLNNMSFDGSATDPVAKATRDAMLAFIAAQGEADYLNRREMQRRGIERVKAADALKPHAERTNKGRKRVADAEAVKAYRAEHGSSIAETAKEFEISVATVKRYIKAPLIA